MEEMKRKLAPISEKLHGEIKISISISKNTLRKMGTIVQGAFTAFLRSKDVRQWPRGESLSCGGANDWRTDKGTCFCIKTNDQVLASSYVRQDRRLQIQILEKGSVFGYHFEGKEIIKHIDKELARKDHVIPYKFKIETEEDQAELENYESMKEMITRQKREAEERKGKGGGRGFDSGRGGRGNGRGRAW